MAERLTYAIVGIILLSLIIIGGMKFYESQTLDTGANSYVLEDLASKHPGAQIAIMDWAKKTNAQGEEYLSIRASVTEGANTPCPVRIHYFYYYPVQNFVPDPAEYITKTCTVCEGSGCAIGYPEEAIIASHVNSGTERVARYIASYPDAVPTVTQLTDGWKVQWVSKASQYGFLVDIAENGQIRSVDTVYY